MKILMVASSYPRFDGDTAAVFLRYMAQSIAKHGHEVHVIAPNDSQADESLCDSGVFIRRFSYFPIGKTRLTYGAGILPNLRAHPWLYFHVPFFLLSLFISLLILAIRLKPSVIHAHWIIPIGAVSVIVGKLLGIPVISTAHGGDAFSLRGSVSTALKRFALKFSSAWTANTSTTKGKLTALGHKTKGSTIPMGIDIDRFRSGVCTNKGDATVILFVGRLVKKKGVEVLIRSYIQLHDISQQNIELWIVGDGTERTNLESMARERGIKNSIRFFGNIKNEDLPHIYACADVFVVPSIEDESGDTEGQGVVLLEAMAAGVPVIASFVGGICNVIDDETTGWLVKPNNPTALATMIDEVLRDDSGRKRVSNAAAKHAEEHYAWGDIANQFISLYKEVVETKRSDEARN